MSEVKLTTRCKFRCQSVTHFDNHVQVKLQAQYDPDLPEDRRFSKATPTGTMEMVIDNPALQGFFQPGHAYYLDLSEASA